jgi:hypothetical protein
MLTNWMEQSPSWEADSCSASQFPAGYKTKWFVTMFIRACRWSISWDRCIQSTPLPPYSFKIYFNIILSSMRRFSKWSLSFRVFYQIFVRIFLRSYVCYMSSPYHSPWFDDRNNIWKRVQITKFLIMQLSKSFC